jgi:choline-glycine betaine transporter
MTPTAPPGSPEHEPAVATPAALDPATDQHPAIAEPPAPVADEKASVDRGVFAVSAVVALAFVAWGFLSPSGLGSASGSALTWIEQNLGWLFVTLASAFVVFVLWLAASRYGRIPLGRDDEEPEFRTVSWIAMMFSAGMGIGLMFYGVAEPLAHYVSPPPGTVDGETPEAARTAMATTLFHWTLHPWAIYAVVGLAIGYGTFRRGRKQLISSAFEPLFGRRRTEGPAGKLIDVLAIFATLFGSATP